MWASAKEDVNDTREVDWLFYLMGWAVGGVVDGSGDKTNLQ